MTSPDLFPRALAVTPLTRVAVTRGEFKVRACVVAVPVFGPGGELVASIELTVRDLSKELQAVRAALVIASHSLSRELSGDARPSGPARSDRATPRAAELTERPAPQPSGSL